MATVLDIAKRNPNAAPVAVSDAARVGRVRIEKKAELNVVAGSRSRRRLAGRPHPRPAQGFARRHRRARARAQDARGPALALDLFPRRQGLRRDDQCGQGACARALAAAYTLARPQVVSEQVSKDGTRKWLIRMASTGPLDKGAEIECVYIPEIDRGTLCVSSQVGCTLTCSFCHTGTQRLVRNLTSAEIVAQLIVARDRIGDWPDATPPEGALRAAATAAASSPTSCSWAWASRSTTPTT